MTITVSLLPSSSLPSFQVVFVVQYFKKRLVISQSPSDAGTSDTDEAPPHMNHTVEDSDKYIVTQVKPAHLYTDGNLEQRN